MINILIIGGSNSRLKNGYTKTLLEKFQAAEISCQINNISLGANTCLLGLISLLDIKDAIDYDLVMIEYSVNDYSMMLQGDILLWRASYEGLIRCVFKKYARAKICCVLLGRSDAKPVLWESQISETKLIAKHYGNVIIADVQANISRQIGQDNLYADPLHYSDSGQVAAGNYTASRIFEEIGKTNSILPPPIYSYALDSVGILNFSDFAGGKFHEFSNSIIQIKALELTLGKDVEFTVPGEIICIMFLSVPGAGSFRVSCGKQSAVVHTLHDGVESGKFLFLPLTAYSRWFQNKEISNKIKFEVIHYYSGEADWPNFHVNPSKSEAPVVYLSKILYRT